MSVLHGSDGSVSEVEKQPYPPGEIGPTNVCRSSLCGTVQVGVGWFAVEKWAGDSIQRRGLGGRFKTRDHIIVIA